MASVKFNRGLYSAAGNNPDDALAFLAKDATHQTAKDYGYLYLGAEMVATKYLKELDLTGFSAGDGLLEIGTNNSSPILTTRSIISTTSSTYDWSSSPDVPTAQVIADYVSKEISAKDTYHGDGTWGSSTNWNVYTAKYYKGDTEITSGETGYQSLAFTLPVASEFSSSDDSHLTTPKQIADYFAGLAGGMRYCGAVSSTTLPTGSGTLAPYKAGDVFIASTDFTIGSGTGAKTVENGDMIVIKTGTSVTTLTTDNCDVFERNLDGAIYKSGNLTENALVLGAGTDSVKALANGTEGQMLRMVTADNVTVPAWADYYYQMVAAHGTDANKIVVTPYTNGTAGSATTITINDVTHATNADKVLEKAQTASTTRSLLVGYAADDDATTYKDVEYNSNATINNAGELTTKNLTVTEKAGSTYGSNTIDVAATLTWQTLS